MAPGIKCWLDDFDNVLCTVGGEQQHFGDRCDVPAVEEELSDTCTEVGATRFACQGCAETFGEPGGLS